MTAKVVHTIWNADGHGAWTSFSVLRAASASKNYAMPSMCKRGVPLVLFRVIY